MLNITEKNILVKRELKLKNMKNVLEIASFGHTNFKTSRSWKCGFYFDL